MMKKLSVIFLMLFLLSGKTLYGEQPKKAKITPIPKNAHILITSNRDTKDRRSEIYAINTDGSGATRITYSKYHHFILGVDQTTQYIVASRAAEDTTAPKGLGDEDKRSLWIIDTKNKLEQRLTDSKNHAEGDSFSPDGEWIVFLMKRKGKEQSDIYKIKRDGTQLTPLTDTPAAIEGDPAWSHSGKEIVFAYKTQGAWDLVFQVEHKGMFELNKTLEEFRAVCGEEKIDQLVYDLYGLKDKEIEIVEGFNKEKTNNLAVDGNE